MQERRNQVKEKGQGELGRTEAMKEKYVPEGGFYLPTNVCKSRWQLKDATQR